MLQDKLREIQKAVDAKRADVQAARTTFETTKKALSEATDIDITNPEDPHVKAADDAMKPYSQKSDELRLLQGQFERIALMAADGGEKATDVRRETEHDRDSQLLKGIRESVGRKAVESDTYKALKESGAFADGSSVPFKGELAQMEYSQFKSLLTGQSGPAGGVFNLPEQLPGIDTIPQLPLGILDLITIGQTSQRSLSFVRMLARTIRAAETHEASTAAPIGSGTPAVTPAQGGLKPESDLTFERVEVPVRTIPHWLPATRDELADAPFLQTTIEGELLTGVERRTELQIMRGDGVGDNLTGIYSTAGIAAYTQSTAAAGEPKADAVHRIFTMLRLASYEPSALAIDPRDWQDIRLSKDTVGNYIWGPPSQAGGDQIWGVTAVQTIAATQGQPVAAEWSRATLAIREAAKILISDSHADFFVRNLVAILAEARAGLVIRRPQAFGKVIFA